MRPESARHRRAPLIELRSSRIPAVWWPSGPAALLQPRGLQLPAHTELHQSGLPGRTPRWEEREDGGHRGSEKHVWKEGWRNPLSPPEDAALWCEIVWSCHLSQASLKKTLKPVMGLTSSSSNSFMSLFIFCFVTHSSPSSFLKLPSLVLVALDPILLPLPRADMVHISPGCRKHFNYSVVHQPSLGVEQCSWPSRDESEIWVFCRRDKGAYLCHYMSGNTNTNRSDEIWIHGEINAKSLEKTQTLPEHAVVIILLESTG